MTETELLEQNRQLSAIITTMLNQYRPGITPDGGKHCDFCQAESETIYTPLPCKETCGYRIARDWKDGAIKATGQKRLFDA